MIATPDGHLITGLKDGRIVLVDPVTTATSIVADTGGRPLGVTLLDSETLLVCDAHRGLLSISLADSRVTVLVEDIDGVPLRFCSNAATAPDGSIWFTESTHRYDYEQYLGAFFERAPTGRVFRRDADGSVELVADRMYFPNGIALTPDGSAMLVAETSAARIQRIPVTGARAGVPSIVAGNLPGYPDNLSAFVDGRSWVALVTPRSATLERLGSTPGIVPRTLWKLPDRLSASGPTSAWMWAIDEEGTMVHDMQSYDAGVTDITGVAELDGTLYGVSPDNAAIFAVRGPKEGRES
ncbi:hypothetical protein BMW26_14410 [Microbacterium sp. 1.5R]|nr:hypothetical protein BMW26_14410 [Microbacterium sp. 1.5R]